MYIFYSSSTNHFGAIKVRELSHKFQLAMMQGEFICWEFRQISLCAYDGI